MRPAESDDIVSIGDGARESCARWPCGLSRPRRFALPRQPFLAPTSPSGRTSYIGRDVLRAAALVR
ncbi:hypothetical protein M407DRAFT_245002 [Tulasnella calospora MUT 4182]|uniref:Uncharacterized protein n=1 Tax=Tulasnella calospora MUT 4182 TaxID=1051891 RepID=A0A0C3LND3_9AGAM|nr:hypothetical protein M407DRAFT_245002 [Tulasnella calospora MUT 4182]